MDSKRVKRQVIIHGHFYQPPRENPWTGRIDRQNSAAPYHDWNEKITSECYFPNSCSRRLDGYGRITNIVNNYSRISFNFGPTLLSWLEKKHPSLYGKIVEADALSAEYNNGHGNAIAQVYNHIIMPLASERDKRTQVEWGIRDFKRAFGRDPEGIWLAETAVNLETLSVLADFGVRFIILSPDQALEVRPLAGKGKWEDVSDGSVKTGRVYRCRTGAAAGGSINVFFYDGPVSRDVSFNHLLRSGDLFGDSLESSFDRCGGDLVTVATDGEIYGHHEPFADMALAYLFDSGLETRGLRVTNFGAYLDGHVPEHEVRLKPGSGGEGTAWSCSHGVGRWKEDCGCNVNAPDGWNQKWRKPLRDSLDSLNEKLAEIFEREAGKLVSDPWKARNDYISSRSGGYENGREFIRQRALRPLSKEEEARLLKLLESQRFAMYMFTSCGWFFNDISGLESGQIMKYAAMAIEMGGGDKAEALEKELVEGLSGAKSNIEEIGSGADIYDAAKKYSSVTPSMIAGQFAISSNLGCPGASPEIFGYTIRELEKKVRPIGGLTVASGLIESRAPVTGEASVAGYFLMTRGDIQIICLVKELEGPEGFAEINGKLSSLSPDTEKQDLVKFAVDNFGGYVFSLGDLFMEDRTLILSAITERKIESLEPMIKELYFENMEFLRLISESSLQPADIIEVPAKNYLQRKLIRETKAWKMSLDPADTKGIRETLSEADYLGIELDVSEVSAVFSDFLLGRAEKGSIERRPDLSKAMASFMDHCEEIGVELDIQLLQNRVFDIIKHLFGNAESSGAEKHGEPAGVEAFLDLAERLNFNTAPWKELLQ